MAGAPRAKQQRKDKSEAFHHLTNSSIVCAVTDDLTLMSAEFRRDVYPSLVRNAPHRSPSRRVTRHDSASILACKHFCELGAKKENRRRIVDPGQNQNKRARGAKTGGDAARAEIKADQKFSDREKDRGKNSADPDIAPSDFDVGKNFVDKCERTVSNANEVSSASGAANVGNAMNLSYKY